MDGPEDCDSLDYEGRIQHHRKNLTGPSRYRKKPEKEQMKLRPQGHNLILRTLG